MQFRTICYNIMYVYNASLWSADRRPTLNDELQRLHFPGLMQSIGDDTIKNSKLVVVHSSFCYRVYVARCVVCWLFHYRIRTFSGTSVFRCGVQNYLYTLWSSWYGLNHFEIMNVVHIPCWRIVNSVCSSRVEVSMKCRGSVEGRWVVFLFSQCLSALLYSLNWILCDMSCATVASKYRVQKGTLRK